MTDHRTAAHRFALVAQRLALICVTVSRTAYGIVGIRPSGIIDTCQSRIGVTAGDCFSCRDTGDRDIEGEVDIVFVRVHRDIIAGRIDVDRQAFRRCWRRRSRTGSAGLEDPDDRLIGSCLVKIFIHVDGGTGIDLALLVCRDETRHI